MTWRPRDTMKVFVPSPDGVGMEERPGFLVYGLYAEGVDPSPRGFPAEVRAGRSDLVGPGWLVCIWTFPVTQWATGSVWRHLVLELFTAVVEQGAQAAWMSSEGAPFVDPPSLFDAKGMSGGVDAYLCQGRFSCPLDPEEPWATVTDDELAELRVMAPLARAGEAYEI